MAGMVGGEGMGGGGGGWGWGLGRGTYAPKMLFMKGV